MHPHGSVVARFESYVTTVLPQLQVYIHESTITYILIATCQIPPLFQWAHMSKYDVPGTLLHQFWMFRDSVSMHACYMHCLFSEHTSLFTGNVQFLLITYSLFQNKITAGVKHIVFRFISLSLNNKNTW